MKRRLWPGLCCLLLLLQTSPSYGNVSFGSLLDEMTDRENLTRFPQYDLYSSSSHDPASDVGPSTSNWTAWYANTDFSQYHGTYNGENILLVDSGPGAITRLWTTASDTSSGSIKVYLDGSATPISILNGLAPTVIGGNTAFGDSPVNHDH